MRARQLGLGIYAIQTRSIHTLGSSPVINLSPERSQDYFPKKVVLSGNVLDSRDMQSMSLPVSISHGSLACTLLPITCTDADGQLNPAGRHVCQTSGEPSRGLPEWIADGNANIEDEDIVVWHTFGLTHFPAPEDFPVMPAEPLSLLLRPRNFFLRNPALDVPPSYSSTPNQVASQWKGVVDRSDKASTLAFGPAEGCCSKGGPGMAGPVRSVGPFVFKKLE